MVACLHAMALVYLHLYLPFMSAVTHIVDVSDELSVLDQRVYASDEVAVEALLSGDSDRLLNGQYDRVKIGTLQLRNLMLKHVAALEPASRARVSSLMQQMLVAGAKAFHHHTVERQLEQHDAAKPDKQLGTLLTLSDEKKRMLRAGRALTHAQERMFGNLRLEHDRAQTLLHDHLEGRVRVRMDDPVTWLLDLNSLRRTDRAAARRDSPLCCGAVARACEEGGRPQGAVSHAGPGALAAREAHLREGGGAAAQAGGRDHAARGTARRVHQRARAAVICRPARPDPRLQDRRQGTRSLEHTTCLTCPPTCCPSPVLHTGRRKLSDAVGKLTRLTLLTTVGAARQKVRCERRGQHTSAAAPHGRPAGQAHAACRLAQYYVAR